MLCAYCSFLFVLYELKSLLFIIATKKLLLSAAINRIFMNRITRHSQYNTVLTVFLWLSG